MSTGGMKGAPRQRRERGLILVASLLLLLVVTILAVSMFRSFGIEEKIAGNIRDKERALNAAEAAQQYAEWWLSEGNSNQIVTCAGLLNANAGEGQVCTNTLNSIALGGNVANVPWTFKGAPVGVQYIPIDPMTGAAMVISQNGALGTYYSAPIFYISYLGLNPAGTSAMFQIDAVGYGGSANSIAVVESIYQVTSGVQNLGGL